MSRNPEQDPGLRRIELGPVGGRINVLKSALQVAGQYEKLHPDTEAVTQPLVKPSNRKPLAPQTQNTPVTRESSHLLSAREKVNQALQEAA